MMQVRHLNKVWRMIRSLVLSDQWLLGISYQVCLYVVSDLRIANSNQVGLSRDCVLLDGADPRLLY